MASIVITETRTVEAALLKVEAGVRYWEDAEVNGEPDEDGQLIPFRAGDTWCPVINIDSGSIVDWPHGTVARIHYKVCDEGNYSLLGAGGEVLASKEGYVPRIMCPAENGYGDYIIMNVGGDGRIENWRADLSDFETEE